MPHTGVNKDKDGNRMAKCKTPPTTPGEQIAQQILNNYDIKSAEDVQDVLKQIFGPIFESMLKGEMENHLGHKKHERSEDGDNVRNGYSSKTLKTSLGEVPIRVPRDRQSTFEPQIIKKHQRDVSSIEGKVLAMYARGMSQRDIAATIEDIYGFQMSHEQISTITGCAGRGRGMAESSAQSICFRRLGIYVSLRTEYGVQQVARLRHALPMTSTAARMSLASGSTRRRASMPGCRSSTSCGLAALRILASCPWMA